MFYKYGCKLLIWLLSIEVELTPKQQKTSNKKHRKPCVTENGMYFNIDTIILLNFGVKK